MSIHYSSKKKTEWYLSAFRELFSYANKAGNEVFLFFQNYKREELGEFRKKVHLIEHEADARYRVIIEHLMKDHFLPFKRSNIYEILNLIDDITDAIEEISLRLYLYDFSSLPLDTSEYMKLNLDCLDKTRGLLNLFSRKPDQKVFVQLYYQVVTLEEQADAEYLNDVTRLHRESKDPLMIIQCGELYAKLEEVSDSCRELASFLFALVYKRGR